MDQDIAFDDPIGTFELTEARLIDALNVGKIHSVPVDDQTQGQVLFAQISVMRE